MLDLLSGMVHLVVVMLLSLLLLCMLLLCLLLILMLLLLLLSLPLIRIPRWVAACIHAIWRAPDLLAKTRHIPFATSRAARLSWRRHAVGRRVWRRCGARAALVWRQ